MHYQSYRTTIRYDATVGEYAMYLDDDLVGFARTRREAERTLHELIHELQLWQRAHAAYVGG